MIDHLLHRRQYLGTGSWTWSMQRERRQMMGRGDYILFMERSSFVNAGIWGKRHSTDYRLILAVLQGEGVLHNRRYQWGWMRWPIPPKEKRTKTEGEEAFAVLKGEVPRTLRTTKVRASWIFQETWKPADRRAALQREHE